MGDKARALNGGFMIQKTFHGTKQKQQKKGKYKDMEHQANIASRYAATAQY